MITRIRLINFRSHEDTTVDLKPINLFIGPVASGKSNVFKGMVLVQNSVHRALDELFPPGLGEFHWVRSRWADQSAPIGFEVELDSLPNFPGEYARYILRIGDGPEGLFVVEESLARREGETGPWQWVFRREYHQSQLGEFGKVDAYDPSVLNLVWHRATGVDLNAWGPRFAHDVAKSLSSFGYYHLEASDLKALGSGQRWDRIQYTGKGLPDFFAWAKFSDENVAIYERIREAMRELLPNLDAIIVTQVDRGQQGLAISFEGQRGYIAARDLSDGTLFTLGLLTIVYGPQPPAVLCIEEPDTGLHPGRLRWLFDRLMQLAYPGENKVPVQVCVSTHSPYMLSYFGDMKECVHLVEQQQGRSRVTNLPEIQRRLHIDDGNGDAIGHEWATGLYEGL